jgi:hypothetical protein
VTLLSGKPQEVMSQTCSQSHGFSTVTASPQMPHTEESPCDMLFVAAGFFAGDFRVLDLAAKFCPIVDSILYA